MQRNANPKGIIEMKQIYFIIFLTISTQISAQTARYNQVEKGEYQSYISKHGDTINAGQQLTLGIPSTDYGFRFISQGGERVANFLSGKTVFIDKLKAWGNRRQGYKIYAHFSGYGMLPVLIDYDSAVETGEVLNPNFISREQAISKLREAKELFDLEIISQEDYEKQKQKYTPIILRDQ
jgi:hypothetical protein